MGDELALRNDPRWADDPAHAGDNRWLHRPPMDWAAARRRADVGTVEGAVFAGLAEMARVRAGQLALRAGDRAELLDTGDDRVLGYVRRHPRGARLVVLAAFSDDAVAVPRHHALPGFIGDAHAVLASPGFRIDEHQVHLPAWGYAWMVEA
jgi:amylosucrase